MAGIRVFLSYADSDKHLAGRFKEAFAKHGVDIFLAHDDIRTGDNWRNTLFQEIKEREFFIVLLTENYHRGNYTDHECGMAVAHGKTVIPICVDDTRLYGLIEQYQKTKCSLETVEECAKEIAGDMIDPKTMNVKASDHVRDHKKDMYAVSRDLWKASDVKIHSINCVYVPDVPKAATMKWYFTPTLQEAKDKARMLGEKHDMKCSDCRWCKPSQA